LLYSRHSSLLNGQVEFCQGKYVILHTCPADDLEKKRIWIPDDPCDTGAVLYQLSSRQLGAGQIVSS